MLVPCSAEKLYLAMYVIHFYAFFTKYILSVLLGDYVCQFILDLIHLLDFSLNVIQVLFTKNYKASVIS